MRGRVVLISLLVRMHTLLFRVRNSRFELAGHVIEIRLVERFDTTVSAKNPRSRTPEIFIRSSQ